MRPQKTTRSSLSSGRGFSVRRCSFTGTHSWMVGISSRTLEGASQRRATCSIASFDHRLLTMTAAGALVGGEANEVHVAARRPGDGVAEREHRHLVHADEEARRAVRIVQLAARDVAHERQLRDAAGQHGVPVPTVVRRRPQVARHQPVALVHLSDAVLRLVRVGQQAHPRGDLMDETPVGVVRAWLVQRLLRHHEVEEDVVVAVHQVMDDFPGQPARRAGRGTAGVDGIDEQLHVRLTISNATRKA